MKVTFKNKILKEAVKSVAQATSKNSPSVYYSCMYIEAVNGEVTFEATNADIAIRQTLLAGDDVEIKQEGAILINGSTLKDAVERLDGDTITVAEEGNMVFLTSGKARFKLAGYDRNNRIKAVALEDGGITPMIIDNDLFIQLIDSTIFAVSDKDTRPILTGVHLTHNHKTGEMTAIATDSYRLSKVTTNVPFEQDIDVTVPAKSLMIARKLMSKTGDIKVYAKERGIMFKTADCKVRVGSQLCDGGYPDTSKLIPADFNHTIEVDKQMLLGTLKRASFLKTDNLPIVKLDTTDAEGFIKLSAKTPEVGDFNESIPLEKSEGTPMYLSANADYLIDAVNAVAGNIVRIQFVGDMKPFILTSPEDDSVVQLVLPVRTYD